MRVVGKYANHGEASVALSLLEQGGVPAEISDGGWVGLGVPEVAVLVEEGDLDRAGQILAEMKREAAAAPGTASEAQPAAAFPFLGVAGGFAALFALVKGAMVFAYSAADVQVTVWNGLGWAAAAGAGALLPGFLVGLVFSVLAAGAVRMWRGWFPR